MRSIAIAICFLLQASASLPPAYPRPGATKMLENDRVVVWNIAWLKQQYPLHRHIYDLAGVYYEAGDRMIVSVDGARRPVKTAAGDIAFQRSGVTHIEEGTGDAPLRAVFLEFKEAAPSVSVDTAAPPPASPVAEEIVRLDNDRVTVLERVPGAAPLAPHYHDRDTVTVSWVDGKPPRAWFIKRSIIHSDEGVGQMHVFIFELK